MKFMRPHHGEKSIRTRLATMPIAVTMLLAVAGCAGHPGDQYTSSFLTQGMDDAKAGAVAKGMTTDAVLKLLGPPLQRIRFGNLKATAWDYRYVDTWGYFVDFAVMIGDDGLVANVVSARLLADNP